MTTEQEVDRVSRAIADQLLTVMHNPEWPPSTCIPMRSKIVETITMFLRAPYQKIEHLETRVEEERRGCPCTYDVPCSDMCSCANPVMSGGCSYCCKHGSEEQRKSHAAHLKYDNYELRVLRGRTMIL